MDDKWEIDSDSSLLPILQKSEGASIDIVSNGKVLGHITPSLRPNRAAAKAAMERLLALNINLNLEPGETIKDLINDGRK